MGENIACTKCGKVGINPDKHSCLKDKDATIASLKQDNERLKEEICLSKEYKKAAGIRGDYFEGISVELTKERDALRDEIATIEPLMLSFKDQCEELLEKVEKVMKWKDNEWKPGNSAYHSRWAECIHWKELEQILEGK